jgi:hypothetical protein
VNEVMNVRVPKHVGNFLTSCEPVRFSRTLLHGVSKYVSKYTIANHLKIQFVPCRKHLATIIKTNQLILHREIIALFSGILKNTHKRCTKNVEFQLNLVVYKVSTRPEVQE